MKKFEPLLFEQIPLVVERLRPLHNLSRALKKCPESEHRQKLEVVNREWVFILAAARSSHKIELDNESNIILSF